MKKYNLFLDDIRMPAEVGNYIYPVELRDLFRKEEWVIVRNYPEFIKRIKDLGIPKLISFDHDLAEGHYHKSFMDKNEIQYENYTKFEDDYNKTGYHCAKWLIEYCINENIDLPEYIVHSMNPVGKDNILNLLKNFENRF